MTSTWPTTKGHAPVADAEAVRAHLQATLPGRWGARVDERMKALNLNNAQLAVRAATTPQTISKIRKGELYPRDHMRLMIAAALATTTEQLFPMPSWSSVLTESSGRRRPRTKAKAA